MFLFLTEQRFYDSSLKNLFLIKIIHFLASTKAKKKKYWKRKKMRKTKTGISDLNLQNIFLDFFTFRILVFLFLFVPSTLKTKQALCQYRLSKQMTPQSRFQGKKLIIFGRYSFEKRFGLFFLRLKLRILWHFSLSQ